jgi:membrane-bound serine protease (ClpP class)
VEKTLKFSNCFILMIFLLVATFCPVYTSRSQETDSTADLTEREIWIASVSDTINPMVSEYLSELINTIDHSSVEALIIQLDTPGGLLESTHAIVKSEMNAKFPIIVYVSPRGGRAASAGVFITLAAHVAAMAPATHIGAAHPVSLGSDAPVPIPKNDAPESKDSKKTQTPAPNTESTDVMSDKILNDTVAWAKSIAENRKRNSEWIEDAVRKSISSTETEALKLGVIDIVCEDLDDLIMAIDGRTVDLNGKPHVIHSIGARIIEHPMTFRQRFLSIIINPTIAIYLMAAGLIGIYIEITHPGLILPGVIGGISMILALFAMHTLPINYAGLFLVLLAFAFFIAEVKIQSFGLLTIGGIVAIILGASMLIDSELPGMEVSMVAIVPLAIAFGCITVFLLTLVLRAHSKKTATGDAGMIDRIGLVKQIRDDSVVILVHGELWRAKTADGSKVEIDQKVQVTNIDGLTLIINPINHRKGD